MANVFLTSDTHFGHLGVCQFTRDDGSKLRPWTDPDTMDADMVARWNAVVKPADKVYHLGDVVINRKALSILPQLNGKKVLIKGNHDIFALADYLPHFYDIRSCHKLDEFMLSHIPLHPDSLGHWLKANIHGHTHYRRVLKPDLTIDTRYFSVCVEQTNYAPIAFEEVKKLILEEQAK